MDDRGSIPTGAAKAFIPLCHHRVQTGSGAHSASYQVGTGDFFFGDKAAGV